MAEDLIKTGARGPSAKTIPTPKKLSGKRPQRIATTKLVRFPRTKFITSIAEAIYAHKAHPTSAEYNHVALEIVKKWPFLGGQSSYGHLSEALKSRLDYLRKPSGNKRGKGKSRKGISSTKTFPNYPATTATTTDDRPAHDRHVKQIIVQYKRSRPNKQITKDLMVRTFAFRHSSIRDGGMPLEELFQMYPPIKEADELVRELGRIMGREVSSEQWGIICPKIIEACKGLPDTRGG